MPTQEQLTFEFAEHKPIKGFPELHWTGKRPFRSTVYYPAQLKESFGRPDENGWMNKIFWGDNLQVMSHLLKEYRGKVDLIYIDPPFDSKADYKKKIEIRGIGKAESDTSSFEEKQYGDIWTNDEYLQFMYERLIIMSDLLSDTGSIFLHCDWHKVHHLRSLLDDVFGPSNFINEIVWCYYGPGSPGMRQFNRKHDNILWYSKTHGKWCFNADDIRVPHDEKTNDNFKQGLRGSGFIAGEYELADSKIPEDWWEMAIAGRYPNDGKKRVGYPTEKPFKLIERIIKTASKKGDIVADFFMGSGVVQMVALENGRRFLGADINLGAVHTTTKRLLGIMDSNGDGGIPGLGNKSFPGLEVYNVNNYDIFRNPVEARDLLLSALEVQVFPKGQVWDGEKDGRMVKVLPVNRIATKADLEEVKSNLPYKTYDERAAQNPQLPVEKITFVCMGHEPDLKDAFIQDMSNYKLDVEIVDILRDKKDLQFKREGEAEIVREGRKLVIRSFYPLNLMQKLSCDRTAIDDWRQLVDSILIDWNYDGGDTMQPSVIDIPKDGELVKGVYDIPKEAGTIKVKITDLLSESVEMEVR